MENLKNKSSKIILEDISNHCFMHMVPYRYSGHLDRGSAKYKSGRITTYEWINNLTYYYLKEEENLKEKLISNLKLKRQEIEVLKDSEYKKGINDTINEILEKLK